MLSADQDGIDAGRLSNNGVRQVLATIEKNGDVIVGLFNTGGGTAESSSG